jgi:hypothetical protein
MMGAPSIPGAGSFADTHPLTVTIETPAVVLLGIDVGSIGATVTTPFPVVNVADTDERWDLVKTDALPAFIDLLYNDPDAVAAAVATPVGERSEAYLAIDRLDDLLADLDVSVQWPTARR